MCLAFGGCQAILDLPEKVTAYRWCLDAEPATGVLASNGNEVPIYHHESNTWMRGCKCFCPSKHDIMVRGAAGLLTPDTLDEAFYDNEVTLLQAAAELACAERVSAMQKQYGTIIEFGPVGTVSCADAVADEVPYYSTECVLDEDICPPTAGGGGGGGGGSGGATTGDGETTDGGTDDGSLDSTGLDDGSTSGSTGGAGGAVAYGLESWSSVIDCPTADHCDVSAAFVDELLADLSVFADDAILMGTGTSEDGLHGFVFVELGSHSLPAALGLQPGDLLWKFEGIELHGFGDVGRAFEELSQAREFEAHLVRDGQRMQRTYRLVEWIGG